MVPRQADAYVAHKVQLRDQLFAVNYPVTKMTFNNSLSRDSLSTWRRSKQP